MMVTFEGFIKDYLTERGMFDSQAVEDLKADLDGMQGQWDKHIGDYPAAMRAVVILAARRAAVKWIDANMPNACFREIFADSQHEAKEA